METPDISDDVRDFIIEHIESVGQLEVLLLLTQAPETDWTSRSVSHELRSNDLWIESVLNAFAASGVATLREDAGQKIYRIALGESPYAAVTRKLASEYATFRLRIIQLIYDKSTERMQRLADAFRFRKDKGDG